MASIDLSAAFDIVNVDLLIKRLRIIGLPKDVVDLIKVWLKERYFYVSVHGVESMVMISWTGIIQGSILGPILYAIFISPLFDIETLTCYADDKFPVVFNKDKMVLAARMKLKLETIFLWLTKSGMVVNESKTSLCVLFITKTMLCDYIYS